MWILHQYNNKKYVEMNDFLKNVSYDPVDNF